VAGALGLAVLTLALPGAQAAAPRSALLVVRQDYPPRPVYIEGSVGHLRLTQLSTGRVLVNGPRTTYRTRSGDAILRRQLVPGRYRLVSWQRPCDGNCDYLDPPRDRCAATLTLKSGRRLTVTVVLHQHGGCTLTLR
jgi:hypothetical protein